MFQEHSAFNAEFPNLFSASIRLYILHRHIVLHLITLPFDAIVCIADSNKTVKSK